MSEETVQAPVGRLVVVEDLALEHDLWKNPRTVTGLSSKDLVDFGEDIIERGQIVPLITQKVKADNEAGFVNLVLDGQRRVMSVQAYLRSKKKSSKDFTMKVVDLYSEVLELTSESADRMLMDILAAAVKRAGLGSFEQTEAAMSLLRHNEMPLAAIGKAIGRSESWVSRMVRARKMASPKLVTAWQSAKVTDEQFKDLADINPHDKQSEALSELLDERQKGGRGNKAEARNALKEKANKAKAEKKAAAKKPTSKKAAKRAEKKAAKAKASSDVLSSAKPSLTEILDLREKKKPTDPYVKGLMDGASLGMGTIGVADLSPAFRTYLKAVAKVTAN